MKDVQSSWLRIAPKVALVMCSPWQWILTAGLMWLGCLEWCSLVIWDALFEGHTPCSPQCHSVWPPNIWIQKCLSVVTWAPFLSVMAPLFIHFSVPKMDLGSFSTGVALALHVVSMSGRNGPLCGYIKSEVICSLFTISKRCRWGTNEGVLYACDSLNCNFYCVGKSVCSFNFPAG